MTIEEAVNELNELTMYVEHAFTEEHKGKSFEALQMAIKSLEKQIPKKPIIKTNAYNHKFYECPNCGIDIEHVIFSPYLYCHKCAQKIEKAEVEE